ncbi:cell adhesion protein byn-1 [Lentinula aff. lateritia]|uniref:Cell adhesion protein byn-1 n=1 Tax=Lentinula aff. lateritia TaxID=2804960 RepID=A0ACC1TS51_9AGAR|nr:cell adhesion protein byn-1 [Lentinula aff. lateritia]
MDIEHDMNNDEHQLKYRRISEPGRPQKSFKIFPEDDENVEVVLDPKTSGRVFELTRTQQDELDGLDEEFAEDTLDEPIARIVNAVDEDEEGDGSEGVEKKDAEEIFVSSEYHFEIDPDDRETRVALPDNIDERRIMADIIFSKLDEDLGAIQKVQRKGRSRDPMVVKMYTKIGLYLSQYSSGSLPKPSKVIPTFPAGARILALTEPENWPPHACCAATRIFISTMKPAQTQFFLSNKKLNVQYYETLKTSAFFQGILFPMLNVHALVMRRQAAIMASILAKVKIPVLHASAVLLHITEMYYTGSNSLFIQVLIDKKFEVPYKVVDSEHLPVLWHQSLLAFVQRYALLGVIRATSHPQISAEIRCKLVNSVNSVVRGARRILWDTKGDILR